MLLRKQDSKKSPCNDSCEFAHRVFICCVYLRHAENAPSIILFLLVHFILNNGKMEASWQKHLHGHPVWDLAQIALCAGASPCLKHVRHMHVSSTGTDVSFGTLPGLCINRTRTRHPPIPDTFAVHPFSTTLTQKWTSLFLRPPPSRKNEWDGKHYTVPGGQPNAQTGTHPGDSRQTVTEGKRVFTVSEPALKKTHRS